LEYKEVDIMHDKIDFVIAWVDGSDPAWLEEKNKYSPKKEDVTNAINRYRDMGVLRYWFRAVEKFAPWVNQIHFERKQELIKKPVNLLNPILYVCAGSLSNTTKSSP